MYTRLKRFFKENENWEIEILKICGIVVLITVVVNGISRADITPMPGVSKNFSVIGIVSTIDPDTIYLTDARGSDHTGATSYVLNITHTSRIQDPDYVPILKSDIGAGDTIIAQGIEKNNMIIISRIVLLEVASSTASSSPEISDTPTPGDIASTTPPGDATTTDDTSSTTPPANVPPPDATNTPPVPPDQTPAPQDTTPPQDPTPNP